MKTISIEVVRLPHMDGIALPQFETEQAAGADLRAAIHEPVTLAPGERKLIPTGFCMALPAGYEAQIRPRSGLALKHGITVLNSPGTIDADYRGEVGVLLINHGDTAFTFQRGDRFAQMVIAPVTQGIFDVTTELSETTRGSGGYGSTGTG
ncbi:deoxyuridine 5'-triphosphate nucleotidohydrolase [Algimonas ampicilliniresistens]|uniref:Deoxyuridine 5'-triphosphate nucleotidohydrolase n=1 Tax=Algimonas ampicilliniresistens TaxID=1298735 RepID=A0ABQ5VBR6_9PROT|nr:dUTP diphosphatase [Algimonas ampicilliniresistens]GLQ24933.1 deoxyuridine 5'-triphosphate nucleotidohydrolase [Algimonas ampicilliniresistens]